MKVSVPELPICTSARDRASDSGPMLAAGATLESSTTERERWERETNTKPGPRCRDPHKEAPGSNRTILVVVLATVPNGYSNTCTQRISHEMHMK